MRRAVKMLPGDMRALLKALSEAFERTNDGEMDPKVAGALANLSRAVVQVHQIGELALRIKALEQREALEESSEP
jgi:hypothetical protein